MKEDIEALPNSAKMPVNKHHRRRGLEPHRRFLTFLNELMW